MIVRHLYEADRSDYDGIVRRLRGLVRESVPPRAQVLVVSRGDDMLLNVRGRAVGHFPQTRTGLYAGHYPVDGRAAIAHLVELRAGGAEYLAIPVTGLWWLEHYSELRVWLDAEASVVSDEPGTGVVFRLQRASGPNLDQNDRRPAHRTTGPVGELLAALLPSKAGVMVIGLDAKRVDVSDRPLWTVLPPEAETEASLADVLTQIAAAADRGCAFVALLIPEFSSDGPNGPLRHALSRRFRCICRQQLVEVFALDYHGDRVG